MLANSRPCLTFPSKNISSFNISCTRLDNDTVGWAGCHGDMMKQEWKQQLAVRPDVSGRWLHQLVMQRSLTGWINMEADNIISCYYCCVSQLCICPGKQGLHPLAFSKWTFIPNSSPFNFQIDLVQFYRIKGFWQHVSAESWAVGWSSSKCSATRQDIRHQ